MCGIIGIVGRRPVAEPMLEALERLAYRGYDSAGLATIVDERIERRRAAGDIRKLRHVVTGSPLPGVIGIGHTRWATHGEPTRTNAHPHVAGQVAVVHNGIIENHKELRRDIGLCSTRYRSQTDSEVIAHLLDHALAEDADPERAMRTVMEKAAGAFSVVIMVSGYPDMLLAARRCSPLAIGYGEEEMFVGSDARGLVHMTQRLAYLEDGDWAMVRRGGADIRNSANRAVSRSIRVSEVSDEKPDRAGYRHYMEKEIHEQPEAIGYTLYRYLDPASGTLRFPALPFDPASLPRLTIVAAGTSFYAGMVAKYWFERLARLPVDVDIASEFRYRDPVLVPGGAALAISQSGESIDTLMALRHASSQQQHALGLVNVAECTIERESSATLRTLAGPEIAVASTKVFTTQLVALAALAVSWGLQRGTLDGDEARDILDALSQLPAAFSELLADHQRWTECAEELVQARDMIYLGRGANYPIALEGALKFKEITYIHAEGYAAGEMKHGPIALLEEGSPVVVVAPSDQWFGKTASNITEARARGARIALISDRNGIDELGDAATWTFTMPDIHQVVAPILYALPVQLLAYLTAVSKGTNIDQPRNLAKTVTVE